MTAAPAAGGSTYPLAERFAGLDLLRLTTLACIVAYHCLGAVAQSPPEPGLGLQGEWAAWLLSVFQNEVLIALSAFLFSWRRRNLRRTLMWLSEVYMFWTAVYVIESFFLPTHATKSPFGQVEILFVLFLGGAKYHLPFFPALAACLTLIAWAPSCGSPRLWGSVAIMAAAARRSLEQTVLQSGQPGPAEMLLLQSMAVVSFLPFAMLGARIQAVDGQPGSSRSNPEAAGFLLVASILIVEGLRQAAAGYSTATEVLMAGRAAAIVAMLLVALRLRTGFIPSSPALRVFLAWLAALSLTVFLVHPLIIDILAPSFLTHAAPGLRVALLFACVLAISLAFASIASEILRVLGWRRLTPIRDDVALM